MGHDCSFHSKESTSSMHPSAMRVWIPLPLRGPWILSQCSLPESDPHVCLPFGILSHRRTVQRSDHSSQKEDPYFPLFHHLGISLIRISCIPMLAWLVPHPSIKGTPKTAGIQSTLESSGRQDGEEVLGQMRIESRNIWGPDSPRGREDPPVTFQPVPLSTSSLTKSSPESSSDPRIRFVAWLSP